MTAENIAKVIADLKSGNVRLVDETVGPAAWAVVQDPMAIDATAVLMELIQTPHSVQIYEDHPCVPPPFDEFAICSENTFGNVIAIHVSPADPEEEWNTAEEVEWDRVKWKMNCFLWIGGSGGDGQAFRTTGPTYLWRIAVYPDGEPADISWVDFTPDYPGDWTNEMLMLLGALNFLSCKNVRAVDVTPRAERRRIQRASGDIRVHTIRVFGIGKESQGAAEAGDGLPLGTVRGHFAHYGPQYGKGLLFGQLAGKFWIPQRAKGAAVDYRLQP